MTEVRNAQFNHTLAGFSGHDLGVNKTTEDFVDAVKEYQPDILAMFALLAMTAPEQRKVIETLKEQGLRDTVKVMVGGGAITQEFADEIGADGYDATAPRAVKLARRLIGRIRSLRNAKRVHSQLQATGNIG